MQSYNLFNEVKRQKHAFEVETGNGRMRKKSISTQIYSGTERSLLNITDEL